MKTSALLLTFALFSASVFATEDKEVYGGISGSRVSIPSGDYNIILKPNATTPTSAFFGTSNFPTITSLTTSGSPDIWEMAYSVKIDIKKAESGEVDAFTNTGTMRWRIGGFEIANSKGTSAVANVDIGTLKLTLNASATEVCYAKFSTSANVTGTSLTTENSNTGLLISGDSTVVNYNLTGNTTIIGNAELSVGEGATFNIGSTLTFNSSSKFTVNGTFNYTNTAALTLRDSVISGGSFIADSVGGTTPTSSKVYITGQTSISDGATWHSLGAVQIDAGGVFSVESTAGEILLADADSTYTGRILMSGGTFVLNKANAIVREASTNRANLVVIKTGSKVYVNASNWFRTLYYSTANSELTLILSDNSGDIIAFDGGIGTSTNSALNIVNFENDRVFFVKKVDSWPSTFTVTLSDADGNVFSNDDIVFVEGTYDGTKGYWLNVAVPEPAEYAALFGVFAAALAICRRRK